MRFGRGYKREIFTYPDWGLEFRLQDLGLRLQGSKVGVDGWIESHGCKIAAGAAWV